MTVSSKPNRYQRQEVMTKIGPEGQHKLAASKVVIVGVGGLGSNIANLLVRAGVGHLRLVDPDKIELSNLHRQTLYTEHDVREGRPKAEAARDHLLAINSESKIEAIVESLNAKNAEKLIAGADLVMDGLDNFTGRAILNQACVKLGINLVYGACLSTHGNVVTILPGKGACLKCLMPQLGEATDAPLSNAEVGIIGVTPVTTAAFQVSEALKLLTRNHQALSGTNVHIDLWPLAFDELPAERRTDCPVCVERTFDLLESE